MLNLTLAQCPVSWGVEEAHDPRNVPWELVLDEIAAAGYRSVELGPLGYLPCDVPHLRCALADRGLTLAAGYIIGHFARRGADAVPVDDVRRICRLLVALGAPTLVIMEAMDDERDTTVGRSNDALRLSAGGWEQLIDSTHAIHPHVATHVEFDDEIDHYFDEADPDLIGLCLDTGHSVWAGVDPLGVLERHGDRLRYLHLKDVDSAILGDARSAGLGFEVAVDKGVFCPAGSGMVDYAGLRERLLDLSFSGGAGIEQDRTPGLIVGALGDARTSLQFLCENGFTTQRHEG
jgi:inosose dehydratase